MPDTIQKSALLEDIRAGYERLEAIIAPLSEAQMTTPTVNSTWSVKDNLIHLTVWQNYLVSQLEGILANEKPPAFMPGLSTEDEINERVYQQNKDRPPASVLADFRASYQRVLAAVEAMSEEALNASAPWSTSDAPIWPFIAGNTYEHYAEHGGNIQRWLASTDTTTAADGYA